jgi:LuxR family transcriptional regulator, quorum-sensing system regulator CciR
MRLTVTEIEQALTQVRVATSMAELHCVLARVTPILGFRYFALTHHVHPSQWATMAIGLHNCPEMWPEIYARDKIYRDDPILHAAQQTNVGFRWSELPSIIDLTPARLKVLERYRQAGIGEGVTVPAHVPGEPSGSCNFAIDSQTLFPSDNVIASQLIGAFAFQAARRLAGLIRPSTTVARPLTPRQRDCLLWAMRGKTDWEIGQILALSPETVRQHLDMARIRYGVSKRMQLAIRAIYLGDIGFDEAL